MPRRRVDHQPLGLVDHRHILVFVHNIQGHLLWRDVHFPGLRNGQLHGISHPQPVVFPGGTAIEQHVSIGNQLLGSAAAETLRAAAQERVQPLAVHRGFKDHFFSSFQNSLLKNPRLTNRAMQPQVMKQSATLNTGNSINWVSIMSTT